MGMYWVGLQGPRVDEEQHLLPTGDNLRRGRISHKEIHAPEKFTYKCIVTARQTPWACCHVLAGFSLLLHSRIMSPCPDKVSALVTRISD